MSSIGSGGADRPGIRPPWKEELDPVAVLGYIMGAVSVLNLLSDVLQLESDLFLWVGAYRRFVGRVGEALFGWIDFELFGWWSLEVEDIEVHALVLYWLVARSLNTPGLRITEPSNGPPPRLNGSTTLFAYGSVVAVIPAVVVAILPWQLALTSLAMRTVMMVDELDRRPNKDYWWIQVYVGIGILIAYPIEMSAFVFASLLRSRPTMDFISRLLALPTDMADVRPRWFVRNLVYTGIVVLTFVLVDQLWMHTIG